MGRAAAMIVISALIGGCGSTELLTGTPGTTLRSERHASRSAEPSAARYLSALGAEQQKLAAAERRLPHRARTPAALSTAISTLAAAIARLAADLRALPVPAVVRDLHQRLIATMRTYAASLGAAGRDARRSSGGPRAAGELLSATSVASRAFSSTIDEIDRVLTP